MSNHIQGNPDLLANIPNYPCLTLTSSSRSGGKFWQGIAREHGLSLRWGKNGTQGTVKHIPTNKCVYHNPVEELKNRCLKKLAGGYDINPHETCLP